MIPAPKGRDPLAKLYRVLLTKMILVDKHFTSLRRCLVSSRLSSISHVKTHNNQISASLGLARPRDAGSSSGIISTPQDQATSNPATTSGPHSKTSLAAPEIRTRFLRIALQWVANSLKILQPRVLAHRPTAGICRRHRA